MDASVDEHDREAESLVEALDLDEEGPAVFYRVGHGSQGTHSDVKGITGTQEQKETHILVDGSL